MMRQTNMKTKAQPIPETSTGIAAIAKAFRNHHADYQRYPCQKGTRHCRCAPRLHRPPPWRPETPRECHTTKVVSIAGPRYPTGPPTIEAPNTAAPKEPCAPTREMTPMHAKDRSTPLGDATTTAADSHRIATKGLPDLPAKRSKKRLHQGRGEINYHQTSHHHDHQPLGSTTTDAGMVNQRPGAKP
jgi:hypothetical protein